MDKNFKDFWNDYYTNNKNSNMYPVWIDEYLPLMKNGGKIVELGAGNGDLSIYLKNDIDLKNDTNISNEYLTTIGVPFNIFITNNSSNILSLYANDNLIGTITKTKTSKVKPYLFNENIVYSKIICINSCLSEEEIKTLNNEVI